MRQAKINAAVLEAKRFLAKHKEYEASVKTLSGYQVTGSKESGALRRASMDLTRALAEMRKPN